MIFKISRTSDRREREDQPPCEGATLHYGEWEVREEKYWPLSWSHQRFWDKDNCDYATDPDTDVWRNWRLDSGVRRWEERKRWWEIEIADLDALLALVDRVGVEVIVGKTNGGRATESGYSYALEIYDDHRE